MCNTFHRGWLDLKKLDIKNKKSNAYYFWPNSKILGFDKSPVGVNTLGRILPNMCKAFAVKIFPRLRVTTLFWARDRKRTGHRSNALFFYEKGSVEKQEEVASVLGPVKSSEKITSVATSEKLLQNFAPDVGERVD